MKKGNKIVRWFKRYWFYIIIVLFILSALYVAHGFVMASAGEYTSLFKPEVWGYYGSFLAAILLAATIIFQVISFKRQQIENKFFELVKYYRANIQEMELRNPFYYKDSNGKASEDEKVNGRRAMKIIFDQYCVACRIVYDIAGKNCHLKVLKEVANKEYEKYFHQIKKCTDTDKYRFLINELAYMITFWGVPMSASIELEDFIESRYKIEKLNNLIKKIKMFPALYECSQPEIISSYFRKKLELKKGPMSNFISFKEKPSLTFIKFFGGHQYQLGHYFRHLFQAVRYIDEQPWWILTEYKKRDYINTLRAQMSNYEQALLFINSLSQVGRKWEYDKKAKKSLISDYDLVKNLPKHFIPDMIPDKYYPDVEFEYLDKDNKDNHSKKQQIKKVWRCIRNCVGWNTKK